MTVTGTAVVYAVIFSLIVVAWWLAAVMNR